MSITINNLSKKYGSKEVLHDISLNIPTGMYGLLGRNGAGKTTLMRILASLSVPTSGNAVLNGTPIDQTKKIRSITGYLPQDFSFYRNMTVYDAMDYISLLSDIPDKSRKQRIEMLLEQVNLKDNRKTRIRALSGGMKRRLGIAQSLLHDPDILIVDEPTAGLDPEERIRLRNLLTEFSKEKTVILSTHIAADVESSCHGVAVLNEGHLIYDGNIDTLKKYADGKIFLITVPVNYENNIKENYCIINTNISDCEIQYRILSDIQPDGALPVTKPTLEDGYMALLHQKRNEVTRHEIIL